MSNESERSTPFTKYVSLYDRRGQDPNEHVLNKLMSKMTQLRHHEIWRKNFGHFGAPQEGYCPLVTFHESLVLKLIGLY